ncbi:MAG TPA: hypothetical protein PKK12_07405 [Candidatus Aminicenantes bacterium]|nr:hypothetical protein [Candidatus Aminicenantes bacterium]
MNEQKANGNSQQVQAEETRQPWVTPAFGRTELKEAMSGEGGGDDGYSYAS